MCFFMANFNAGAHYVELWRLSNLKQDNRPGACPVSSAQVTELDTSHVNVITTVAGIFAADF